MRTDENQIKSSIELKVPPKDDKGSEAVTDGAKRLEQIRSAALSALRIITIASIVDDDTSTDFFSSYLNFRKLCDGLKRFGLVDDADMMSEEAFDSKPMDLWVKLIVVIFISLYSFIDHNGISCDVIASSKAENNAQMKPLGNYFSKILRLESYDWKDHKVDLFIPFDVGEKVLFLIDDEPVFYSTPAPK